ncbi:hypothetical protein ES703_103396 [subsurface metagenome]
MNNNNGEELELRDYIEVLLRRKWIIILVFFVTAISAGVGALYLVKPVYQASALLMISKPRYQVELEPKIKTPIPLEISLETYKNLIKSADLEEKVIKKLGLDQPPDELTVEALDKMVSVEAVPKTDLIKISVKSGVPGKAKEIVNTWVALFIEENKDLNLRETTEAQSFIENQLKVSEQNLFLAEEKLCKFNEENSVSMLKEEIADKIRRIISSEGRLADLKVLIKEKEAELNQAKSQLAKQPETFVLTKSMYDDASFNQLTSELTPKEALLLKNLRFESETLNPLCTALRSRVANLKIDLDRYQSGATELTKNINSYRTRMEQLRKQLATEELTKCRLERIRNTACSIYDVVSQKAAEIKIAVASETGVVKIVSLAHEPRNPVGPGKRRIVLIGGVLGLFMGIFIAFFVDYWKRTGRRKEPTPKVKGS